MFEKVKEYMSEIIQIADSCPDKYQVKCFEVLLNALVEKPGYVPTSATVSPLPVAEKAEANFFIEHEISADAWTKIFDYDGSSYSIIVKNLKVQGKSKKQIRLALLLGTKNKLETDKADISRKELIELCKIYDAYDEKNFATNMKRYKNLFLAKAKNWVLTIPGTQEAVKIIKELA